MNQKQWIISSSRAKNLKGKSERSGDFLRRMFVRILLGAQHGHFLLKENGSVIAEVGDRNDCLKAEVDVLDFRSYARALLGGNTAAGEAFVDGWWTSPDITQVTRFFSRNLEMMDRWD